MCKACGMLIKGVWVWTCYLLRCKISLDRLVLDTVYSERWKEGFEPVGSCKLDWKTVFSTFTVVFLAELGDKTQLSTMMLAASKKTPWSVFLGSAMALVLSSLIGVLIGETLYRIVPGHIIKYFAGGAFVVVGLLMLLGWV